MPEQAPAGGKEADPPILKTVLREVAAKTTRPAQWLSVNELELDHTPEQIDTALRVLIDRGWLNAAPMTLHSVTITAAGYKALAD